MLHRSIPAVIIEANIEEDQKPTNNVGTGDPVAVLGIFVGDGAPASAADRCHSLGSLIPPPAALPSLPPTVRLRVRTAREASPYILFLAVSARICEYLERVESHGLVNRPVLPAKPLL